MSASNLTPPLRHPSKSCIASDSRTRNGQSFMASNIFSVFGLFFRISCLAFLIVRVFIR